MKCCRAYLTEGAPGSGRCCDARSGCVLLVTEKSLSHTRARRKANEQGARIASLPGLTREMMAGP
jgi:hypothetical protein